MARTARRFFQIKPSALTIPLKFPERSADPSLTSLMQEIIEYGGILEPLIVRRESRDEFLVLGGRRRLKAAWRLQDEGHEALVRFLPCYVVDSTGPAMDLKIFMLLNNHTPLSNGELEQTLALIEALSPPRLLKAAR